MTPEKELILEECLNTISEILYEEIDSNDLTNLEQIEIVVREKISEHVNPKVSFFLSKK